MADAGGMPARTSAPSRVYASGVADGRWQDDVAQRAVLPALDRIHRQLSGAGQRRWLTRWLGRNKTDLDRRGLYLWGGVGRGKTFLVDLLAQTLVERHVLRRHFHRFIGDVHAALRPLREQGRSDPLAAVANEIASRCRLLCLDEFVVHDIGDAMLLSGLLESLFERNVILATTSNMPPSGLYRDGLQRARFLPSIGLLERHCEIVELASPIDYRLRHLSRAPVYLVPADERADERLRERFIELAPGVCENDAMLMVKDRALSARAVADGVAWFDFSSLCEGPRSVADYIELAKSFNTVLISGVPAFRVRAQDDAAQRFIRLIDEFYDRRVKLLLSADTDAAGLYPAGRLRAQFERTESRLIEMQSPGYLAEPHRP